MSSSITGILRNTPNLFDATLYATNHASLILNSDYQGGQAITCNTPGATIFDTGVIEAGTFSGAYNIGFFYDSTTATTQGTPLMRYEIYEDGILLEEDTTYYSVLDATLYQFDLNYIDNINTYGLFHFFVLNPKSTYQIIIKTVPTLAHDAILDYVIFEKSPGLGMIDGTGRAAKAGMRNEDYDLDLATDGTQIVTEIITGVFTGTWAPGTSYDAGYTYNTKFKEIVGAFPTIMDANGQMICNWSGINYANSQISIFVKNISASNWTKTLPGNVKILVVGYI